MRGARSSRLFRAESGGAIDLAAHERSRVLAAADRYLAEPPITITASSSARSAGDKHDFFSEGDYWWPNPADPDGPYVQRDGLNNPDNFAGHRNLIRLSVQMPALTAAWLLTRQRCYAEHALRHLRAWFLDPQTLMRPHLRKALAFVYPFVLDKGRWPHGADVAHWRDWPVRHPGLLFGGLALDKPEYLALWKTLDPDPEVDEIVRNYPIRQPVLWTGPLAEQT